MPCFSPLWELVCYTPYPSIWHGLPNQTILTWGDVLSHLHRKGAVQGGSGKNTQRHREIRDNAIALPKQRFCFLRCFLFYIILLLKIEVLCGKFCYAPHPICLHSFVMKWPQCLTRSAWNCWGIKHTKQCPAYASTLLLLSLFMQKLMHPHMHVHMQKHLKVPCYFSLWQWISKLLPLLLL